MSTSFLYAQIEAIIEGVKFTSEWVGKIVKQVEIIQKFYDISKFYLQYQDEYNQAVENIERIRVFVQDPEHEFSNDEAQIILDYANTYIRTLDETLKVFSALLQDLNDSLQYVKDLLSKNDKQNTPDLSLKGIYQMHYENLEHLRALNIQSRKLLFVLQYKTAGKKVRQRIMTAFEKINKANSNK